MARIEMIPDDSWDGELSELHPRVVGPAHRRVDNILAVRSLNPRVTTASATRERNGRATCGTF